MNIVDIENGVITLRLDAEEAKWFSLMCRAALHGVFDEEIGEEVFGIPRRSMPSDDLVARCQALSLLFEAAGLAAATQGGVPENLREEYTLAAFRDGTLGRGPASAEELAAEVRAVLNSQEW